jgi:hypothetical protein
VLRVRDMRCRIGGRARRRNAVNEDGRHVRVRHAVKRAATLGQAGLAFPS